MYTRKKEKGSDIRRRETEASAPEKGDSDKR